MEKAGPFNCCCSHQSVASPSLCLCHGSRWTFWGVFMVQCWEFLTLRFYSLFCLSPKCNLSETFKYQVRALRRWGGRQRYWCARYGHYAGEVEDSVIAVPGTGITQVRWKTALLMCQNLEHLVAVDDAVLKSSWLCFLWTPCWQTNTIKTVQITNLVTYLSNTWHVSNVSYNRHKDDAVNCDTSTDRIVPTGVAGLRCILGSVSGTLDLPA